MSISNAPLVGPVIGLALWTFFMEIWLYSYRLPDITTYKVQVPNGASIAELNKNIPRHRQYPADNYNHLHEQPTVFYAVALGLTFLEVNDSLTVALAWAYVGARIVHSLIQSTSNAIMLRFQVFALSGAVLLAMTLRGAVNAF
ncbi:hypothetical protein CLAFUW4_02933 [Fulvia fulva]|uniref:MAPEG family protein n=1 Tax=Passalora fulva TaxID=5499 RepID=A0A9Q8LAS6_PASFU|nr:uncharacterized protein CLAFUR5_02920 [Fulvia fulva]KAK4631804.1 hypothetical protein CLAFUR4_02926 [Fulvia fulva]KAK4633675.1 hypothetical protein CLAFUR0_02929 [Fulvia fulva]UJO13930.1 hypothetical protein CLAFUR5_02920 [Fulvia fulva]WPV11311.1 hypothetical protein CLAFUW4_02933 [Fulvia fulva]WPV26915.1 hypothetical protein CLAFUW7_02930 [Fulvia fulva]